MKARGRRFEEPCTNTRMHAHGRVFRFGLSQGHTSVGTRVSEEFGPETSAPNISVGSFLAGIPRPLARCMLHGHWPGTHAPGF